MPVQTAPTILEREYLPLRARVLEIAAVLDRLDRAGGISPNDSRLHLLQQGIELLRSNEPNRAEQVQLLFSRPYQENWPEGFEMKLGK